MIFLLACTPPPSLPPSPSPLSEPPSTADTGHPVPDWSCNGARSLPRVYSEGPDLRFVGDAAFGWFGHEYMIGDLDSNGAPDLLVSEVLWWEEDANKNPCLYTPGDGGVYWISDPLVDGPLADVAVHISAEIVGCPEQSRETDLLGLGLSITEQDYTGDGLPEIVASDLEGSWFFSGPPTETLYRADADLFLPGVHINGPELDLDLDGNLEFAGWQIVSLEGSVPVVDTLLDDVGYYNMHFVDFDSDGLPEIFGPTSNAALIHVEAPITLETIQAAEQLPTANPAFLAGDIQGVSAIGRDWWAYSEVRPYSPERLEHEGCDSPRIAYALSGGDLSDASVEARRSYFDTYQRDRPSPRASRAGDFNGDGVADLLIDDVGDTLILLGPIEPGLIRLEHAIRIPKENGIGLSTYQRDAIFDIDGDGRDDIIATYDPGTPRELHIYLASSFLAGPFEFPTTP